MPPSCLQAPVERRIEVCRERRANIATTLSGARLGRLGLLGSADLLEHGTLCNHLKVACRFRTGCSGIFRARQGLDVAALPLPGQLVTLSVLLAWFEAVLPVAHRQCIGGGAQRACLVLLLVSKVASLLRSFVS